MIWTPKSILDWSERYFAGKGIDTPRLDAERLLAHVMGCSRLELYLRFDQPLHAGELDRYRELVRRRAGRVPVAYLTGEAGFWSLTLHVAPGVLVPRPETEVLVEAVLEAVRALRERAAAPAPLAVAELGTGSGAIPLAVCSEAERLAWTATERDAEAMAVARENSRRHAGLLAPRGNRLHLVRGDRLEPLSAGFRPDLVVSNPPYIPTATLDTLEPEVARHEPRAALDGGADGLAAHRYLAAWAAAHLAPGGRLLLEIGHDQGEAVRALLAGHPELRVLGIGPDLAGRDRVAVAERPA